MQNFLWDLLFRVHADAYLVFFLKALAFILALRFALERLTSFKTPPGPWGIPLLGYLPFMPKNRPIPKVLSDLAKTYGDVFTVQIGWNRMVVLNSRELMEEAFKNDELLGRPHWYSLEAIKKGGQTGITFIHGEKWKFNRKVGLRALSHLARSRRSTVEESTHEGLTWLINEVKAKNGQPLESNELYIQCTGAIVSSLCFGHSADPSNSFFQRQASMIQRSLNSKALQLLDNFPYLYPYYHSMYKKDVEDLTQQGDYIRERLAAYLPDMDLEHVPDIASAVEKSIQECPAAEKAATGQSDEDMRAMTADIFGAGFFTTAENMTWATLLLAQHPQVQERVAKEILSVVGTSRFPNYTEDLERLHFTKATVYEVLRYGSNVALGLPHMALRDTKLGGYDIPKGTTVVANIYATHFNPKVFPDPSSFRPERFLRKGKFSQEEARKVSAFSVGKRRCMGEALAVQSLPILLASVVQNFRVRLDPNTVGNPAEETRLLITQQPKAHKIVYEVRK